MESNWEKQKKTAKRMLIAALVLVVLYIAVGIYSDNTGKIETEYALKYTQEEVLCAEAFAVRDENHTVNKKNTSVLIKNDNLVYVPSVTDGESVAVNDVIAVTFTNDEQADDYTKIQQYKKKIDELRQFVENEYSQIIDGKKFCLGTLTVDSLIQLDSEEMTNFVENLISYALIRDEYRKYVKANK